MKISACLIVKNEEKNIEKCFKSIKPLVDEIIVIDTGSNDKTIDIAKKYTDNIFMQKWEDDFSIARNFAIDQANGEFILFLDADEYFTSYYDFKKFLVNEESQERLKDSYLIKISNVESNSNECFIDEFLAVRLFKKSSNIRYEGKIHEQIISSSGILTTGIIKDIKLYHTGYSTSELQRKAERNIKLLEAELKDSSNKKRLYGYLAETYQYLGDLKQAEYYARLDISSGVKNVTYASKSYRVLIEILKNDYKKSNELKILLEKAMKDFPMLPEFRAEYALLFAEQFNYDSAIDNMVKAIEMAKKYKGIEPSVFDGNKISIAKELIEDWKDLSKMKIKISACVILKNEEKNIAKWLESTAIYADEQIVVDTGSTDNTIDIVKRSKAKLYYYKWNENFAEAKNFALSKAKGDWIVFLDADEYFSDETVNNVRLIVNRENKNINDADAIMCTLINIDVDKNNIEMHRFVNLRIFRNVEYLKFHSSIHEGIRNSKDKLKFKVETDLLQIIHTGYSTSIVESKLRRNLKLLLDDIEKNGEGLQHYRYLADCYHGLGKHELAIKYAKLHIASNATSFSNESDIYRNLINSLIIQKEGDEVARYINEAMLKFPEIPDFYAYYGGFLFKNGKYLEAKEYFKQALDIYNNRKEINTATSFKMILSETYSHLAEVLIKENNLDEAKDALILEIKDNKYNHRAIEVLCNLLIDKYDNKETIKILTENYFGEADYLFILDILTKCNKINDVFKYFAKNIKNMSLNNSFYNLMVEARYDEAYKLMLDNNAINLLRLINIIIEEDDMDLFEKTIKYIPTPMVKILKAYFNQDVMISDDDFEGYNVILRNIFKNKNMKKYIELRYNFSFLCNLNIAIQLIENEYWLEADVILSEILENTDEQNEEFYYFLGLCKFYLKDFIMAKKYFNISLDNKKRSEEINSYLNWINEEIEK